MELIEVLKTAPIPLGIWPPQPHDPLGQLAFRTEILHKFGGYVESAYAIREQTKTLLGKRRLLSDRDESITTRLDTLFRKHNDEPPNAAVYAISNVFRHAIRPDTISTETKATMSEGVTTSLTVTVSIGMAGLTSGQGWTRAAKEYVGQDGLVELWPLIEAHLLSLSELVTVVTTSVHTEYRSTGRR
jgi:hypothetical protein